MGGREGVRSTVRDGGGSGGDGESAPADRLAFLFSRAVLFQKVSDLWGQGCLESHVLINK